MKKTLIISYTPRTDSNTAKLVDTAIQELTEKTELTHIELSETPPALLLNENLMILLKRNFMGLTLDDNEQAVIQKVDHYTQQVMDADYLIIAFPIYNFSLPATVKAWIDNIVQPGKTFTVSPEGEYSGLCHGKKALIIMTTGSDFSQQPLSDMNFATPLMQTCLGFMGIESSTVSAFGLNQYTDRVDDIIANANKDIRDHLQSYT